MGRFSQTPHFFCPIVFPNSIHPTYSNLAQQKTIAVRLQIDKTLALKMNDRLKLRPEIPSITSIIEITSDERFQNETLRPILKLQNDLLVQFIVHYFVNSKIDLLNLKVKAQEELIVSSIQNDQSIKNKIIGMIVGHFTIEEFDTYIISASSLNKRIHQMAVERLRSNREAICELYKQVSR